MRRPDRVAAAALLAALAGALLAVPAMADETDDRGATAVQVDDAVLRWGVNNESSNKAFAPRTYNFFSAGLVPDPGEGGTTLPRDAWHPVAGDVEIQKWNGSAWKRATWAGLTTDSAGNPITSPTSGRFSNHRFTFSGGVGEVDATAGTAHLAWDGDVTVVYYSGMSFFHVSDPVLDVVDGRGTLTATVGGYASSVDDPDIWEPVPATTVTLADLPDVDLGDDAGFTSDPAYLGVAVDGVGQAKTDDHFGAFPQTFVDYMNRLGTAPFWMSSGSATDAFKLPLPLTVAYDAGSDVTEPTPTEAPTQEPIDNPVVPPPVTVTVTAPAVPAEAPAVVEPPTAPLPSAGPVAASAVPLPAAAQLVATPASAAPAGPESRDSTPVWWFGGALLLAAALTLLVPLRKVSR